MPPSLLFPCRGARKAKGGRNPVGTEDNIFERSTKLLKHPVYCGCFSWGRPRVLGDRRHQRRCPESEISRSVLSLAHRPSSVQTASHWGHHTVAKVRLSVVKMIIYLQLPLCRNTMAVTWKLQVHWSSFWGKVQMCIDRHTCRLDPPGWISPRLQPWAIWLPGLLGRQHLWAPRRLT